MRYFFIAAGFFTLTSCTTITPTHVFVSKAPAGDRAVREEGANLKVRRWELEVQRRGLERGFFVVKSELEWRTLWPQLDADRIPLLPHDIDFSKEMILVSNPTDKGAISSDVKEVTETEQNGIHVYVSQELPGVGCPTKEKDDLAPYDFARVRRIDGKDVKFHVETTNADPCGAPPDTKITCKPNGTTAPFQEKLNVAPGMSVACISSGTAGGRPIFDRTWTFASIPNGSFAKMTVGQGGNGVTFTTDAYGTYGLNLEVTDDLQRRGTVISDIQVMPPKDALVIQMVWTKFDPSDDPSTFPRSELHVYGVTPPPPVKNATVIQRPGAPTVPWGKVRDCIAAEGDKPPPWCVPKVVGPTTVMIIDRQSAKLFAMGVHYTDERVNGQPILCVRAYRDGKMQTEICDPTPHKENTWWEVGAVDGETGKTQEALALEQAKAAQAVQEAAAAAHAASANLDAGAPANVTGAPGANADAGADAKAP